jgi:tRNA/rRNA methyltransferase
MTSAPSVFSDADLLQRVRIVLSHPSHPGNIGSVARAMKTMGLSKLVLVNPRSFPDPQADTMAAHAGDVLANAQVCSSLQEALVGTTFATAVTARRRELAVEPVWARDGAQELIQRAGQGDVALVFGHETSGLSNEEVALCQRWTMIPANPAGSSLNLAQAVQVLCYELRLAAIDPGEPPVVVDAGLPASHEELEGFLNHLERAAISSGFIDPEQPKRLMHRMRRLFNRAMMEKEEVAILRGMLSAFETGPYKKPGRKPD